MKHEVNGDHSKILEDIFGRLQTGNLSETSAILEMLSIQILLLEEIKGRLAIISTTSKWGSKL